MYRLQHKQATGSIQVIPVFMLLATAVTMASTAYVKPHDIDLNPNFKIQSDIARNFQLNPYVIKKESSFYNSMVTGTSSSMSIENIMKNALEQINTLSYIKVDDTIDREIDAYFATRESKKVKKILLKG
jgi:hypothetical protein